MKLIALATSIGLLACGGTGGSSSRPTDPTPPPATATDDNVIELANDTPLDTAVGRRVRITGRVARAKLGDTIGGVICVDFRVSDEQLAGEVTVEGTLEQTRAFEARVSPDGAVSQGTTPGGPGLYVINDCVVR